MAITLRNIILGLFFCSWTLGHSGTLVMPGTSVMLNIDEIAKPDKYFYNYKINNHIGNIAIGYKKMDITEYYTRYLDNLKTRKIIDIEILLDDPDKKILKFKKPGFDNIINTVLIIGNARGTYSFQLYLLDNDANEIVKYIDNAFTASSIQNSAPRIDPDFPFYKFMKLSDKIISFSTDQIELEGGSIALKAVEIVEKYTIRILAWNRDIDITRALLDPAETEKPYLISKVKPTNKHYLIKKVTLNSGGTNEIRYAIFDNKIHIMAIITMKSKERLRPADERRLDKEVGQIDISN